MGRCDGKIDIRWWTVGQKGGEKFIIFCVCVRTRIPFFPALAPSPHTRLSIIDRQYISGTAPSREKNYFIIFFSSFLIWLMFGDSRAPHEPFLLVYALIRKLCLATRHIIKLFQPALVTRLHYNLIEKLLLDWCLLQINFSPTWERHKKRDGGEF